jgi:SAM-dependent methyltransferase
MQNLGLFLALTLSISIQGSVRNCATFTSLFSKKFYHLGRFSREFDRLPLITGTEAAELYLDFVERGDAIQLPDRLPVLRPLNTRQRLWIFRKILQKIQFFDPEYQSAMVDISAALPPRGTVVDLGCGDGTNCAFMQFEHPTRKIVAIDGDALNLKWAKRKKSYLTEHFRGNIESTHFLDNDFVAHFPIAPDSIDAFVTSFSFSYVEGWRNRHRVAARIYQGLKPGGLWIINDALPPKNGEESMANRFRQAVENGAPVTHAELNVLGALYNGLLPMEEGHSENYEFDPLAITETSDIAVANGFEFAGDVPVKLSQNQYQIKFQKPFAK